MQDCGVCGSYIETRWATCPLCGDFDSSTIDSNISIVNLVEKSDYIETKKAKQKRKKLKSKCCKKYKKHNKSACKSCPKFAVRSDEVISCQLSQF